MNVNDPRYQTMHRLHSKRCELEKRISASSFQAQRAESQGRQREQIALNRLITAARALPDAPYDPDSDAERMRHVDAMEDARRELERVNREIDEAESRRSADYHSGAGC